MPRLVIIDNHASVRELLAEALCRGSEFQVTGEAGTGVEALSVLSSAPADLVIMDLLLPDLSGVEVLRRHRALRPSQKILIYSASQNRHLITEALRCKPEGFAEKQGSLAHFREAISAVLRGGRYFAPVAADLLFEARSDEGTLTLTPREREVLQMVAQGRSSKEVAHELGLAVKSVDNQRVRIMEKLGIHSTAKLVHYAINIGLLTL